MRKIERERGQKCILIIGDTLSRIASSANENSGQDMNLVVDRLNNESALPARGANALDRQPMRGRFSLPLRWRV